MRILVTKLFKIKYQLTKLAGTSVIIRITTTAILVVFVVALERTQRLMKIVGENYEEFNSILKTSFRFPSTANIIRWPAKWNLLNSRLIQFSFDFINLNIFFSFLNDLFLKCYCFFIFCLCCKSFDSCCYYYHCLNTEFCGVIVIALE